MPILKIGVIIHPHTDIDLLHKACIRFRNECTLQNSDINNPRSRDDIYRAFKSRYPLISLTDIIYDESEMIIRNDCLVINTIEPKIKNNPLDITIKLPDLMSINKIAVKLTATDTYSEIENILKGVHQHHTFKYINNTENGLIAIKQSLSMSGGAYIESDQILIDDQIDDLKEDDEYIILDMSEPKKSFEDSININ